MNHTKALVTLAIGDRYLQHWKRTCKANWHDYATRHGFDVICIDKPLDDSERARKRSPSWQKCLVLSQEFAQRYERIVWIDSDILINADRAPDITMDVPPDKVGTVELWSQPSPLIYHQMLERLHDHWGAISDRNFSAARYYTDYGLPGTFQEVVQAGVMVLSPSHRPLLEHVYFHYEEKGGPEWNLEMRPLSYELLRAGVVHWIDYRFNVTLIDQICLYYPFLLNQPPAAPLPRRALPRRAWRRMLRRLGASPRTDVKRVCLTTAYLNSYFLHFGGIAVEDMALVDQAVRSWRECTLAR